MKENDRTRNKIIAENIRMLVKQNGITQKQLAESIKISPSTLSDYLNLRSNPSHGVIQRMADYFGVLKSDIDTTYKEEMDIVNVYQKLDEPRQQKVYDFASQQLEEQNNVVYIEETVFKELPLYGGASAGTGQQVFDNPVDFVSVSSDLIPLQPFDIMLKVVGDSMEPAFEDGEYIFINKTQEVRSGQFVVVIVDDESYLKKIYIEDDHVRLVSLNKEYEDIIVDSKQDINIVGTIVW